MFGWKKAKDGQLTAPVTGQMVSLSDVPDEVFAQKMLGDGGAVKMTDGQIVSPADGTVTEVTDTLHAYGITTDSGLDVLVHVGIDTVSLKGEGFTALVKKGDRVSAGQPLANVDLAVLQQHDLPLYTPVIVTNMDAVKSISAETGAAQAGQTVLLHYQQ